LSEKSERQVSQGLRSKAFEADVAIAPAVENHAAVEVTDCAQPAKSFQAEPQRLTYLPDHPDTIKSYCN